MRLAYFDCFSGASGETILAALLDAGLNPHALSGELARFAGSLRSIEARKVAGDYGGTQVDLRQPAGHGSTNQANDTVGTNSTSVEYAHLIEQSNLAPEIKERVLGILRLLENNETPLAETPTNPGDTATLVIAVVCGLALLGIDNVICSPVNVGGGYLATPLGVSAVPAPHTAEILRAGRVPIFGTTANTDLVTPLGAALLAGLASAFGPVPLMLVSAIGYAVSSSSPQHTLRVTIGETVELSTTPDTAHPPTTAPESSVMLLEANLDDISPQHYEAIMERLVWQGALDVFMVPVQMKMNRQGVVLSVVCEPGKVEMLANVIFEETGASSVRTSQLGCLSVRHEGSQVQTRWGPIKVKIGRSPEGKLLHVKPDYEDVKRAALDMGISVERVYDEARYAWSAQGSDGHQQMGRQRALGAEAAR